MSRRTIQMTDHLHDYILATAVREHPVQRKLRAATAELGGPAGMQIAPEQGALMRLLVELTGTRRMIEVGTFTGYSALSCALAMPPDGRLVACDVSAEWTAIARRHWAEAGMADRIDLRLGPALATLDGLLSEGCADGFDMAFIDADKENYDGYYERCLRLVRPGGLIMADNTLWNGSVADPGDQRPATAALRAFNEKLGRDDRVTVSMVPIGDGLTLARRR